MLELGGQKALPAHLAGHVQGNPGQSERRGTPRFRWNQPRPWRHPWAGADLQTTPNSGIRKNGPQKPVRFRPQVTLSRHPEVTVEMLPGEAEVLFKYMIAEPWQYLARRCIAAMFCTPWRCSTVLSMDTV